MREAPRSAWGARLRQGVGGDALVEEHDELARGTVLERRHQIERDFDADDRSAGKDLPTVIAQPRESPTDNCLDPFGDSQWLTDPFRRPVEASFLREHPDDLANEQRVPLGLTMDGLGQTVGLAFRGGHVDVARHLVDREPRRIEALRRRHARDLGEQTDPWVSGSQLTLAVDGEHDDSGVGQVHGHEAEEQQRRLVGGVEVVEDDDDRAVARGIPQQSRERVEQLETGAIRVVVGELRELGEGIADLRQDLGDMRSVGSDQPSKVGGREVPNE